MKRIDLPVVRVVSGYLEGKSSYVLATAFSVSPVTIRERLRAAGVRLRRKGWFHDGGLPWVNIRGYLETRDRQGRICLVHRARYEAVHGAIADGFIVHHRDGDRRNNAIGNLSTMPRGEHARLHARQRSNRRARIGE